MSTDSQQHAAAIGTPVATPAASSEPDPASQALKQFFNALVLSHREQAKLPRKKKIPGPITVVYSKTSPPSIAPETVLQLMKEPTLPLGPGHYDRFVAHRISEDLIVKAGEQHHPAEATMMDFVRARTTIPIPTVHLVFTRIRDMEIPREVTAYIIMDYIPGPTLQYLWETLGAPTKTSVLAQLQGYIRELRSIPASPDTPPGPLGGGKCEGMWFGEHEAIDPFPTHQALVDWWNRCFSRPGELYYNTSTTDERFRADQPLVFTHGDFNPRNLILHEGVVWVIDWQLAGWYPWYVEPTQIAMDTGLDGWVTPRDYIQSVLPFFPDISRELRMFRAIVANVNRYWFASVQHPARYYHTIPPTSGEPLMV